MRKKLAVVALAGAMMLTACSTVTPGSADQKGSKSVRLITAGYATPAVKQAVDLFQTKAQSQGWDFTISDTANDYNKFNSLMQNAALQKVDAIVLGFPTPEQIPLGLQAARDAQVPVFVIDGGTAPTEGVTLNVATDNTFIGEKTAGALIQAMGGGPGKRVMMIGYDVHPGIKARTTSAKSAFEAAGVSIVNSRQVLSPASSTEDALNFATNYLQSQPGGLDGIWVGWDAGAMGAVQAVNAAGEYIPVTGSDGTKQGIDELNKRGPFVATVAQDWDKINDRLIDAINATWAGTPTASNYEELPGVFVDASNVDSLR